MSTFDALGIGADIVEKLQSLKITSPTAIQEEAIPLLLSKDTDMVALSQTGSGKTLAFGLPIIEKTDIKTEATQHLVVAPTRELAIQVAGELKNVSETRGRLLVKAIFGGTPVDPQVRDLKRNVPHILVATPGRLIDMLERKAVKLDNIKTVVLDEADEMLNMGFKEDIYRILEFTAKERHLWMFSATMAREIKKIADTFMTNPAELSIRPDEKVNKNISHKYTIVNRNMKAKALERFIDFYPDMYALIFCRTRLSTQSLSDELSLRGYKTEALHGDMSQGQREKVMRRFRSKQAKILCATDVAARGIDVDDLTHVFHYALPDDLAFYTHRSGRTARAGKSGESFVIISSSEERKLRNLSKSLKIDFEKVPVPSADTVRMLRMERWAEEITEQETDEVKLSEGELDTIFQVFKGVSKEDLVKKLLSKQFKSFKDSGADDLNGKGDRRKDRDEGRGRDRDRGDRDRGDRDRGRKERPSSKNGFITFGINVGKMDDVGKTDLLEFICAEAKLDKKAVGDIIVDKKSSTFDIKEDQAKSIQKSFKNLSVNGRPLRIFERDGDESPRKYKPKKSFEKKPFKGKRKK